MKNIWLSIFFVSIVVPGVHAEIKDWGYDGKEIYVHVKREHVTAVVFPEPLTGVIRGFGADSYVLKRNDKEPNILELMPTDLETAEMAVTGVGGEQYILRFVAKNDFYSKLIIHKLEGSVDRSKDKVVTPKMDIPHSLYITPELNVKVTLRGNDLPMKIYLSAISRATHFNIISTPEIDSQKTSINLEEIEVWRALKSLLYRFGYGFKVSQEDLIITETETKLFNITMPAVEQSFRDETSNASFTNNMNNNASSSTLQQNQQVNVGTKIFYDNTSPILSLWTELENDIRSMITPRKGSYSINRASGSIIVTDKPAVLEKIGGVISTINERLNRQQSFEIQIVEVRLSNNYETGIDWTSITKSLKGLNNITAGTNFSSAGFLKGQLLTLSAAGPDSASGITDGGISMVFKALDAMGHVNIVSRPSITVSNLFPCIIQEVTSIPYISQTGQTIGNNVTQSNVTTSQVSDGLTMRLEAKIEEDKTVLNISAVVNTLDAMNNVPVGNGLTIQEPQVSTKSITTNVSLVPGKSLILGGLISSTKNASKQGVPYLDRMPILGNAFQYKARSNQKTELVIIITPKSVVKSI